MAPEGPASLSWLASGLRPAQTQVTGSLAVSGDRVRNWDPARDCATRFYRNYEGSLSAVDYPVKTLCLIL